MEVENIIKVECVDLNHEGLGVCKIDGFPIFVPDILVGEIAKVKINKVEKNFARGQIYQMIKSSPDRIMPMCKSYGKCGGCNLMHLNYPKQLEYKKKMVEETIKRIGHTEVKVEEIYGMDNPLYYRNKVQVPFGMNYKKVICGFYQKKSHDIIPLEECYIEPQLATDIARFIKNLCNELKIDAYDSFNKNGTIRHILIRKTFDDRYMVVLVTKNEKINNCTNLVNKIVNKFPQVKSIIQNVNRENTNVILGKDCNLLYGEEVLIEELCGLKFELSHQAFFQTNHEQTEKLYNKAIEYLNPQDNETIIDAYCGVGTISLLVACKAKKVYGIEIIEEAINNAQKNAKLNNIKNVQFICGSSEDEILKFKEEKIDAIVVDPPRKGMDQKLVNSLLEKEISRIVYVSCDVATLARDIYLLSDKYNIQKVSAVDMFPWTTHVECVLLLSLKQAKISKK